jgi:hypothetical protein
VSWYQPVKKTQKGGGGRDPRRVGNPAVPTTPTTPTTGGNRSQGGMPLSPGSGDGQAFAVDYSAYEQAKRDFNAQYAGLLPGAGNNGGGGGGGRYGGGGGSGVNKVALDALLAKLKDAGAADGAAMRNAYANYDTYAAGLSNPWKDIAPAQQAQVDPSVLANLIQSQGGGDAGLRAQAQFLQGQNAATAGASDRLAQQRAANQTAWNQSARGQGKLAQGQAEADLAAQLQQLQAMIELKKAGL